METMSLTRPGLAELVTGVRELTGRSATPRTTAFAVADLLRARLPSPAILTGEERLGDPAHYVGHTLHTEAAFSILAVVWRPGQETVIHDHIAWCAFGVLQGVEYETLYRLDGDHLTEIGRTAGQVGEVSGFAPPGDIHRVRNIGDGTAISLHIYGADLGAAPSSVRRVYDLPVR
ncbi:putative metal-dependent enzyme (double-stranded beta helix superfamily) [Streptosporangium album]|uniref:Putative metal-dependent enzyme (Double-stranded beta helix superfamily) n=1 Tax=Streptosporangium album TaxID=47479 RepID=A0A7W7RYR9_9ACTN|nr:cysteine dioxygenase family protein [Streptosporangium album]MBB4940058.1 putative metal-dependent enzyme (double-stranded beta helix superfamily) [Streptosporangium album]